jgi:hypothetical protein
MIIGVIAAVTIPSLKKSSDEKAAIAGMKKAYSQLNQLISRSEIDNGSLRRWSLQNTESFYEEYIIPYLNVTKNCKFDDTCFGEGIHKRDGSTYSGCVLLR